MPNDATRIDLIVDLIQNGHGSQILLSQDICYKTHLATFGGEGYTHLPENVVPIIERKLGPGAWARRLLHDNLTKLLAIGAGP